MPPGSASDGPFVLLTRRRWDWFFLLATLVALVLGAFAAAVTDQVEPLLAPLAVGLLWGLVRWSTPRQGMPDRRLSSEPDMLRLLGWSGLMIALVLVVDVADCTVTGRAFGAPYQAYHVALLGPIVVAYFVGMMIFARRIDRRRKSERSKVAEPS
jgi:hypothetical protein